MGTGQDGKYGTYRKTCNPNPNPNRTRFGFLEILYFSLTYIYGFIV